MTMITPSYLGETIEYSSLHACRSTLEDPTLRSSIPATSTMPITTSAWPMRRGRMSVVAFLGTATIQ